MKTLAILFTAILLTNAANAEYRMKYERNSDGLITRITDSEGGVCTITENGFVYKSAEDLYQQRQYEKHIRALKRAEQAKQVYNATIEAAQKASTIYTKAIQAQKALDEKRKDPNFVAQEKREQLKASAIHKVTGKFETWTAFHPNGKIAYIKSSDDYEQQFDENGKLIYYRHGSLVISDYN